ncbi:MAG: toprim domain-containing protein [Nitrososphaerales archaeon]|nr:toprim domain-containing protein [Nitrososphaerales archaeon]
MIRARQRRATIKGRRRKTKKTDETRFGEMVDFLRGFVAELNQLSSEGWAVLVEGPRDSMALLSIGYTGRILTMRSISRRGEALPQLAGVVILTDSDREGRQLTARCAKELRRRDVPFSLDQRRRLLAASKGVFRHVENLIRFSEAMET